MSEYEYRPNPLAPGVVDILMHVGEAFYSSLPEYIEEAELQGVSKRIPINSLVAEMQPGVSNIYLWYRNVIPQVQAYEMTLGDLVEELHQLHLLKVDDFDLEELSSWDPRDWLLPEDYVPPGILEIACAIQRDPKTRAALEEKYQIRWHAAVFMSSPLGKIRYILKRGETELPEHLRPYAHLIQAVRVIRVNDDGDESEDEE